MKIPRRVNRALDWWSHKVWRPFMKSPVLLACSASSVCALVAVLVSPTVSAVMTSFCLGAFWSWGVHASHLGALQRALDASEYERGRLRHQNAQLLHGRVAENSLETKVLPKIGGDNS